MERTKRVLSIILIMVLVAATGMWTNGGAYVSHAAENTTSFAGGDGSAGNPYKISTPAHLYNVRNYLNNTNVYFVLLNDIVFTPQHFDDDPDNQNAGEDFFNYGYGWDPIGNSNTGNYFKGVFDGGNYTIKGLYIKRNRWDLSCAGLFGYNQGTIKNLTVSDIALEGESGGNIGSVAGINAGTITNCTNTSDITIHRSYAPFDINAGGIAGESLIGSISNCKNIGDITIYAQQNAYAGGIAGYVEMGTVSKCVNTGNLYASVEPSDYTGRISGAGGIAGRSNTATISDSYNVGNAVSVNLQTGKSFAGGIAGRGSGGAINRCLTLGYLSANDTGANHYPVGVTCTNSYYVTSDMADTNVKALTKAESALEVSFVGFDFSTVWEMNTPLGRPVLRTNPPTVASSVEFRTDALILQPGQTTASFLLVQPKNAETNLEVTSSAPTVLKSDPVTHALTGLTLGSSTVTVTDLINNRTISKVVNVAQPVTSLSISGGTQVDKGGTITLEAIVGPENAYDKTVTWESNDPWTASVDQNGVVTGVNGGMTTIYASANFGAAGTSRISRIIRVVVHPESVAITPYETDQLNVGELSRLYATVSPDDTNNKSVSWSSSDSSIVAVDKAGGIIGKAPGTASIIATTNDGGVQGSCLITVNPVVSSIAIQWSAMNLREFTLAPNATLQLDTVVKPTGVNTGGIVWTSSDSGIVSVDQTGRIQASETEGSATITATTTNGDKTASCLIHVGAGMVSGIELTPPTAIQVDQSYFVPFTLIPEDATAPLWKSSDSTVATVDAFGKITGQGIGTATITAAASDAGGWSTSFSVQVTQVFPIRYVLDGGNPLPYGSNKYTAPQSFALPVPTKEGHSFMGWYATSDFAGSPLTSIPAESAGPKTFYAKWQINSYAVKFHDPVAGTTETKQVTYAATGYLKDWSRTGYTFKGWFINPELTVPWSYSEPMPARNLDLYPKWEPIYYYLDCGDYSSIQLYYDQLYTLPLPSKNPGFVFQGWGTSPSGPAVYQNQQTIKNLTAVAYARVDLYEIWAAPILNAVSAGYDRATVTWAAAEGATGYRIERATSPTGTYSTVYTAPATSRSWTNTGLVTGKTYYYKVTTVVGAYSYGNDTYKSVRPIPATPTVSVSKASTTSIKVTWSGISGATKYQVYCSTSLSGTYSLVYTASSSLRSWTNTGLTTKRTYYYKVRAYHLEGATNVYGSFSSVKSQLL